MKQFNYQIGRVAEKLAKDFLLKKGFRIIAANFSTRFGEIDLVAVDREILVFIEVKAKRGEVFGFPEEMITSKKIEQVKNMAKIFVQRNQKLAQDYPNWRLDAVCLVLNQDQEIVRVRHYENLTINGQ